MDERCGNIVCRGEIKSVSDSSKETNEKKHNLETDGMWSDIVSDESHITPKLRAQLAGEIGRRQDMSKIWNFKILLGKTDEKTFSFRLIEIRLTDITQLENE